MLLQTNSYIVPKDKRTEHARLLQRFRQTLARLGCDHFEAYEKVGSNWNSAGDGDARFIQIMRFRDRKHQLQVQAAEKNDPSAQQLIKEFCELINFPYQQQQGVFAVGFYSSVLPAVSARISGPTESTDTPPIAALPAIDQSKPSPAADGPTDVAEPDEDVEEFAPDTAPAEDADEPEMDDLELSTEDSPVEAKGEQPDVPAADFGEPIDEDLGDPVSTIDDEIDLSALEPLPDDGQPPIELDDSATTDSESTSDEIQRPN